MMNKVASCIALLLPFFAGAQELTVTHFAGSFGGAGFEDGVGPAARFNRPSELAVDSAGNLYVADTKNDTIRIVTPAGVVTTLAGLAGPGGEKGNPFSSDGTGNAARFNGGPYELGVAVDASGVVFVADGDNIIRRVTPAGVVTTIAGLAGVVGFTDGTGVNARFNSPVAIAVDGAGLLFVADAGNGAIRTVTPAGDTTTLALIPDPRGVALGPGGFIYAASSNGRVYKISAGGVVFPFASGFFQLEGIAVDAAGTVYVTHNYSLDKIDPLGVISYFAGAPGLPGNEDGTGTAAHFYQPRGLAVDGAGTVYVADTDNHDIRVVTPAGVVTTRAGSPGRNNTGGSRSTKLDGNGSAAQFQFTSGIAGDGAGNLYVADTYNFAIRKITPAADVTTVANGVSFNYPSAVAAESDGTLYVAEYGGAFGLIRSISPGGVVTTFINGTVSSSISGLAAVGGGVLYAADSGQQVIWRLTAGSATILAGQLNSAGYVNAVGTGAKFNAPFGIAWDGGGNLYVTDRNNSAVRKIVIASGEVTTLAGGNVGDWDGIGTTAGFSGLAGIAVASTGEIYVAETENLKIRRITPTGIVSSVAGTNRSNGFVTLSTEGTGAEARFALPYGIAPGPAGSLYILDQGNETVNFATPALLADAAVVNFADGSAGTQRQFDTAPQSATSWNWQMIRRPAGSTALLSSATIRNPTFIPDTADMFQFRLYATGPSGRRISTLSIFGCNRASILSSPTNQVACLGSQLFFAVSASGGNLQYQWKRDGIVYGGFGGGRNPTLSIGNTFYSTTGGYSCAVTNSCGTIETIPAQVTIGNAPPGPVGNTLRISKAGGGTASWNDISNRTGYSLFEDPTPNGPFSTLTGTASSGAAGVPVVIDATTRFFKVIATNACGKGP